MKKLTIDDYESVCDTLIKNKIVDEGEIFNLRGEPEEDQYLEIFDFHQRNLSHLKKFGCDPAYFIVRDYDELNAKARKRNETYLIGINKSILRNSYFKYLNYFELPSLKGLEDYSNLQKILKNDIHDLIYQAVIHFNFYHEWGHLLQFKAEDEAEIDFASSNELFNFQNHIYEIDADLISSMSCSAHFYQYLENHTTAQPDKEQIEQYLALNLAVINIFFMEFVNEYDGFYLKMNQYPHPTFRSYLVTNDITRYFSLLQKSKKVKSQLIIDPVSLKVKYDIVLEVLGNHFGVTNKLLQFIDCTKMHLDKFKKYSSRIRRIIVQDSRSGYNQRKNSI